VQNYLIGPVLNGAAIVVAVTFALLARKAIPQRYQTNLRILLGAGIVWFGLKLTWSSLSGSFVFWVKQLLTVLLAMALGKIIGRLLHLQKISNSIGRFANARMEAHSSGLRSLPLNRPTFNEGFVVATALFCAGPLAILASVQNGLQDFAAIFVVKAVMDGLAAMAFATIFGWSIAVSAIPVVAFQLAIIRGVQLLAPWLQHHPQPLIESILATDGLLIFSTALVVLQLKRVEIADYLPSLAVAPLLTFYFNT
jgi:uncharacterized membrane protein YqgA involved in biofilm formation